MQHRPNDPIYARDISNDEILHLINSTGAEIDCDDPVAIATQLVRDLHEHPEHGHYIRRAYAYLVAQNTAALLPWPPLI